MGVVLLHDNSLIVDMHLFNISWLSNPSLHQEYHSINVMQGSCSSI